MRNVILCFLTLVVANFLVQSWHDIPNYEEAAKASWSQMWALIIYHFLWEKE